MANYPASLDSFTATAVGQPRDGSGTSPAEPTLLNALASAIVAIETELGTDPSGTLFTTLATRLATYDMRTTVQTPVFAASFTPNAAAGDIIKLGVMTANLTINAPTGGYTGQQIRFIFTQDGTGTRTFTWNAVFKRITAQSTTASKISTVSFVFDGTNWIEIAAASGI